MTSNSRDTSPLSWSSLIQCKVQVKKEKKDLAPGNDFSPGNHFLKVPIYYPT